MKIQTNLTQDLIGKVNHGDINSWGVTRREEDQQLYLVTQKRWLPVAQLRMFLSDGRGTPIQATEKDLMWEIAMWTNRFNDESAQAVVFSRGEDQQTILSTDTHMLAGYLFIAAALEHQQDVDTYCLCALFNSGDNSILADASHAIRHHLTVTSHLLEGIYRGISAPVPYRRF